MARLTIRTNILGMCRTRRLWKEDDIEGGAIKPDDIEGIEASVWSEQGSDVEETSFRIDEGSAKRNMPARNLNIMQAAENNPEEVGEIIREEAPDAWDNFDLDIVPDETRDWLIELADALAYLSFDDGKDEDYARRYWYDPWRKLKEDNPEIRGYHIEHPGKREVEKDPEPQISKNAGSAAEANW